MKPEETAARYDRIARFWQQQLWHSSYGLAALERAIPFTRSKTAALDVGCGSSGRFIEVLIRHGFTPTGVDIAPEMIALARQRHPQVHFVIADICQWQLPQQYDLIIAWDSIFHLPLAGHKPVLQKLCKGLNAGGVLLFTCGGSGPEEITGEFAGEIFAYSSLGVNSYVRLLDEFDCLCRHVEYDQYPQNHVFLIAQRAASS
ncbi:MAG: class I SAM-dependent methyltransferase [candidate division KSB1 bacterium]|nr:class I SAM-dependent methyltransferase [candidate division KSB1 bacterium]MDZ7274035.1 class I SAM-dependent methyltransferase [candidate division KSB1 bacterium]MDZ7286408.1 class I SAM-dependent methyltransferase [candidate division KSB1 bacterium]MDZ7296636.1 class I SAM-dependent methyltransferase [candidate division KSB1 bacterium]MDZ7306858.1 class I SAM-dependent methyltransferase [candidate division KSB1 bacterium]